MKRCVIVGGAPVGDYEAVRAYLSPEDAVIVCDGGLRHLPALGLTPDLVVGDFDSHENPHLAVETIVLPHEKDDTDTQYAVKEALARGADEFLLVGVIGARLDHTLGNLGILFWLDSLGKKAMAVDDWSDVTVVSRQPAFIPDTYRYFSVLNLTGTARGVSITGALYPLDGAEITCDRQYGVSNEPLPGQTARVTVEEGRLLLVRDRKG